jgi:hypothetical protein
MELRACYFRFGGHAASIVEGLQIFRKNTLQFPYSEWMSVRGVVQEALAVEDARRDAKECLSNSWETTMCLDEEAVKEVDLETGNLNNGTRFSRL